MRLGLTLLLAASLASHGQAAFVHVLDPGRYHLGDGAYPDTLDYQIVNAQLLTGTHLEVPFQLSTPTAVAVRIDGLWGVGGRDLSLDNNFVRLDGVDVGRILPLARGGWTSSALTLRAGTHLATIVSLGPGDHDDFVVEGIRVITADNVTVTSGGPSRIWTDPTVAVEARSALGATEADINTWIRLAARSYEERQRQREQQQFRLFLSAESGEASAEEIAASDVLHADALAVDRATLYSNPREAPRFTENPDAVRIVSATLDPPDGLAAGGDSPMLVMDCRIDQAFITRGSRPSIVWRWIHGDANFGGGPVSLPAFHSPEPTLRWPLPAMPPAPGEWTLEVTLLLGDFGATARLSVTLE